MNKKGSLPSHMIREMIQNGFITGEKEIPEDNISPASLDLSVSGEIYRLKELSLPRPNETIRSLFKNIVEVEHNIESYLERGVIYLARLNEKLSLPKGVYGFCNPKSSIGRNDIHVRVLVDGVSRYDSITPAGYSGEIWIAIKSNSFPIQLSFGETLSQLRFFNANTHFGETELEIRFDRDQLLWHSLEKRPFSYHELKIKDEDGSILLTIDLSNDFVGYECISSTKILDLSKRAFYSPEDFFSPLIKKDNGIYLKKGRFYILSTKELLRIPPYLACEMVPIDERSGEFRSHYAGFIDPGWGYGKNGEIKGQPLTLEIKAFDDLFFRDNLPIGKIKFERMAEIPDKLYYRPQANYLGQKKAQLSKHFKEFSILD